MRVAVRIVWEAAEAPPKIRELKTKLLTPRPIKKLPFVLADQNECDHVNPCV